MRKRFLVLLLVLIVGAGAMASGFHFGAFKWYQPAAYSSSLRSTVTPTWAEAVKRVEEDRGPGAYVAVETPPELRHYEDRHWFLASQVAEVEAHKIQTCRDFVDLAGMLERGEMVTVPAVTNTYVLYGVGEETDDEPFTKYQELSQDTGTSTGKEEAKPIEIELYGEARVSQVYQDFDARRSTLQQEIEELKSQSRRLKKGDNEAQRDLQKQIDTKEQELNSLREKKSRLDQFYGATNGNAAVSKDELFRDYQTLQRLSQNFGGTVYNLDDPSSRKAMKGHMLSSLRPQALKVLEEVAAAYNARFGRPLPVSSLVRPEQYQHALRRVNRNAVMIETPPHSTGLAFDIDYRWMSANERSFVMNELARLKREGRIEVIRERNANYHVFAFLNGTRPSDDLVKASREAAGADPLEDAEDAEVKEKKPEIQSRPSSAKSSKSKTVKRRAVVKKRRR